MTRRAEVDALAVGREDERAVESALGGTHDLLDVARGLDLPDPNAHALRARLAGGIREILAVGRDDRLRHLARHGQTLNLH